MGASSRRKGVKGEREVARVFESVGLEVRGLEASGDHLVVCSERLTLHVETKRQERLQLPSWIRQAETEAPSSSLPVVAFRQSRSQWYAVVALQSFAHLLARSQAADG